MTEPSIKENGNGNPEKGLTEAEVVDYLSTHPDFFSGHDDLLLKLKLPHGPDKTVSLVERQVALLRERNRDMRRELDMLLNAARRNDEIFTKCRQLLLSLVEAKDAAGFFEALEASFRREFKSDAYSLMVFSDYANQINHFTSCIPEHSARHYVGSLIEGGEPYLGVLRTAEQDFLFRHASASVKSAAVLPVRRSGLIALLAIGSSDANYFKSGMGTLFVGFIADVLARLLPKYVYLEPGK